uniref:Family with sequence similarity 185 member A n=1 Tax=Callorhinchus milii TaxID=7868 RepID=A0A4W3IYI2_CALMI|eukprot:gi/632947524/ref/XP_007889088.1/ PREDICTED: protein FAM185A isoform X1 [Callorhinchus milii]
MFFSAWLRRRWCRRACGAALIEAAGPLRPPHWAAAVAMTLRPVSTTRPAGSGPKRAALKRWTLLVDPFGSLKVRLPCDVSVKALDPHGYPSADRAFVAVTCAAGRSTSRSPDDGLTVEYDETLKRMVVGSDTLPGDVRVDVVVPLKFDLDIGTSHKGCVKIKNMECDNCQVDTENGTTILNSLKANTVKVHSRGGKVICLGTIYGNVDIQTSNNVEINKLQGSTMNILTTDGALKTKYIYAESSHLSSSIGNIELGSIHGNVTVQTNAGTIKIGSSDGCLKASTQQGDLDVYISQLEAVDLFSQDGSIALKVPISLKAELKLSGAKVEVSPEIHLQNIQSNTDQGHQTIHAFLNSEGGSNPLIKAHAGRGMLNLKSQTWIDSLNLKLV